MITGYARDSEQRVCKTMQGKKKSHVELFFAHRGVYQVIIDPDSAIEKAIKITGGKMSM